MSKKLPVSPQSQLRSNERNVDAKRARLPDPSTLATYRDLYNYSCECQMYFNELLMVIQLRWRHHLGDPRAPWQEAVTTARQLAEIWLRQVDFKYRYTMDLNLGRAALVALLGNDTLDPVLLQAMPPANELHKRYGRDRLYHFPDAGLVRALETGLAPPKWDEVLHEQFEKKARKRLYTQTYRCYMDLIQQATVGDLAAAMKAAQLADELYKQRATDTGYHEFPPVDGASRYNDLLLDYRLAALIRYCFRNHPEALRDLQTIHRWAFPKSLLTPPGGLRAPVEAIPQPRNSERALQQGAIQETEDKGSPSDCKTFSQIRDVVAASLAPSGEYCAAGHAPLADVDDIWEIKLWNASTGDAKITFAAHNDEIGALLFSPDGHHLASASLDGTVKLWDASGAQARPLAVWDDHPASCLAFSPDGSLLATGGVDGAVALINLETKKELWRSRGAKQACRCLVFSPNGQLLAAGGGQLPRQAKRVSEMSGVVSFWHTMGGEDAGRYQAHQRPVEGLAFAPTGRQLASCSWDGTVKLWDLPDFKERCCWEPVPREGLRGGLIWGLAWGGDRNLLIAGGGIDNEENEERTGMLWMWDTTKLVLTGSLCSRGGLVRSLSVARDGSRVLALDEDGQLRLWPLPPDPRLATGGSGGQ